MMPTVRGMATTTAVSTTTPITFPAMVSVPIS
jgi:hypothetical protein